MSAILVNGISKSYFLDKKKEEFCALKDVSFDVSEGESVGIIGHNGAGKSTLLKILSGVTFPTSGTGKVVGSFSSLLEIGTGFHPDLSGRDNIYLNASILGVSRRDVEAELDRIIAFSGVEEFIDQPLRTYSSGMKLRLAFGVIAHLKTDIVALDEVLAVGDTQFQLKCIDKIFDFKQQRRTILFVSHNLSAVKKLCERTLVLSHGKLVFDGPTEAAISHYLNSTQPKSSKDEFVKAVNISSENSMGSLSLELENIPFDSEIDLGVNINSVNGACIYHFSNRFIEKTLTPKNGKLNLRITFRHQLKPGNYPTSIYIGQNEQQLCWIENVAYFTVAPSNPYGFHNPDAIQGPMITEFEMTED